MPASSPRILLAPDKFKGCLSAFEVATAMRLGLHDAWPEAEIEICPMADGGEGTTEALVTALNGEWREATVKDALGRDHIGRFGLIPWDGSKAAVLEMSEASGLCKVFDLPREPWRSSTFGTGQLIRAAMEEGIETILLGIGGSATNDGGLGMAEALGYRFLDESGAVVSGMPENFHRVESIVATDLALPAILTACDVRNPLLGEQGCIRVYGPQKGVQAEDMAKFEIRLERLADLVSRDLGPARDCRTMPGAGAAGGLGFGLMAFCGASLCSGFDLIAQVLHLEERIRNTDLIITGEGRIDAQTLCGKGPHGLALMARRLKRPVAAFGGILEKPEPANLRDDFDFVGELCPPDMDYKQAMREGAPLVQRRIAEMTPWLRVLCD